MAEYKKQHIVPRSYLDRFSDFNGKVYRIDSSRAKVVHHKTQNQKDNFYTAKNRRDFENELSEVENIFSKLVKETDYSTEKESFPTSLQHRNLIISMLHLYARINPERTNHRSLRGNAIKNYTPEESTLLANLIIKQFAAAKLLLHPTKHNIELDFQNIEEELYYFTLQMSVCTIKTSTRKLITSDNPMSFFSNQENNHIFGYLPLTPNQALLIFNRQKYIPVKHLTRSGVNLLNNIQTINAKSCIFTSPNDPRKDNYDFNQVRSKNSEFTSLNDKLFDGRIFINTGLEFVFNKNDKALDVPTYESACKKLGKEVVFDHKDKNININNTMNLDELWCLMRLFEIREYLSKNPPPK
jgi:hypothetical protein